MNLQVKVKWKMSAERTGEIGTTPRYGDRKNSQDPGFRKEMIKKEKELERKLQKQIDDFISQNNMEDSIWNQS